MSSSSASPLSLEVRRYLIDALCSPDVHASWGNAPWIEITAVAESQGLLPLIADLLESRGIDPEPDFAEAARRAREAYRDRAALQQRVLVAVLTTLARAGIDVMSLKGPDMAVRLHGDASLRVSSDLDFLVSTSQLSAASSALQALGWRPPRDHLDDAGRPRLHLRLEASEPHLPAVELHWRIHWHDTAFAADVLKRSQGPATMRRPTPQDEWLMLLLFYARDGARSLRQLGDLGACARRHGPTLTDAVDAAATEYPPLGRVLQTANRVFRAHHGSASDELLPLASRLAVRLALTAPPGSPDQQRAEAQLFDLLCAHPRQRTKLLRQHALVSREVSRDWSINGASRWQIAAHPAKLLLRSIYAVGRATRVRTACRWRRPGQTLGHRAGLEMDHPPR